MTRTVLISGANGYLGSRFGARLCADGWDVIPLLRQERPGTAARRFALGEAPSPDLFEGVDALVHAAWDLAATSEDEVRRTNVRGSIALLEAAAQAGVQRLVFVSSMSAYTGTRQLYGRSKLEVEAACVRLGGIAIRPGLVYGEDSGGMVGTLMKITKLPVVPVIGGQARQFPIHEDDLVAALAAVLDAPTWTPEVFGIAQPEPIAFRDVLRAFAARAGSRPRFVPVPWRLVYGALRLGELLRLPLPLRSDSLAGLVRSAPSVPRSTGLPHLLDGVRSLEEPTS